MRRGVNRPIIATLALCALVSSMACYAADHPSDHPSEHPAKKKAAARLKGEGVQERLILNNLLGAVKLNDYKAFLKDATPEVKAGLTKQMLEGVSAQVAPHMKKGYSLSYLSDLNQQGLAVHLWKMTYKDGSDDNLVKLVLKGKQVAGFWIQ